MKAKDSKALREVREWKARAYSEVADLDLDAALRKRLQDSVETARRLNIPMGRCVSRPSK